MDFHSDIRAEAADLLTRMGVTPPILPSAEKALHALFGVLRRLISARPRKVKASKTLQARVLSPDIEKVVAAIARRSKEGEVLCPFLSKQIGKLETHDLLLNDWGIHHLHLGSDVPGPDGYVKRSPQLLWVLVRDETLHMIDVTDHHGFADADLVEIVHAEWPATIERWRAEPLSGSDVPIETRKLIRKKGLSALLTTRDGAVYFPPGGGYMTSGLSSRILTDSDLMLDQIDWLQRELTNNATTVLADLERETATKLSERKLKLLLTLDAGKVIIHVVDDATNVGLAINVQEPEDTKESSGLAV